MFSKAFGFLLKKPFQLWGLILLGSLLYTLSIFLTIIPVVYLAIGANIIVALYNICLLAYRGGDVSLKQLSDGFTKDRFLRNAGGIGWMYLWLVIWSLIPFAGIVFFFIKLYSYRLVPFILYNDSNISAGDALKKSIAQTKGYRGKMFGTDILVGICIGVVIAIPLIIVTLLVQAGGFAAFVGGIISLVVSAALFVLTPILLLTVNAIYYDKISNETLK